MFDLNDRVHSIGHLLCLIHTIHIQGPVVVIRKGQLPPIQIAVSKKRGHPITTVCHVDSFGIAAEAFAKDFQKRHGSACT